MPILKVWWEFLMKYQILSSLRAFLAVVMVTMTFSAAAQSETLFKYKGKSISANDMSPTQQQAAFEAEKEKYESLSQVFDDYLLDIYIEKLAKKRKIKIEEIKHELFTAKPATEKEMKNWFEKNKEKIPYPYEKIKNEIARMLAGEKVNKIRDDILTKLKKKGKFKNLLQKPVAPVFKIVTDGYPSKGKKNSKVTIVEFADFQCPHCAKASKVVKNVMKKYGSKVQLIYMDFPINPSGISRKVAVGGVCADEQAKYWEYHHLAFSNQKELNKESPEKFAKTLGLNIEKFKKCFVSEKSSKKIAIAEAEAKRVGVQGTPTFFINGRKMHAGDEKQFAKEIEQALKMSK
jgi:protein-disulfide isomerase